MIRVLVVEDSDTVRNLLVEMLQGDPEFQVVGAARNGAEAVMLTRRLRPDVVSMDIIMPTMDGFDATQQIMNEVPTPIVLVTSNLDPDEVTRSMHAMRLGALHVMNKPEGPESPRFERSVAEYRQTLRTFSQVRVLRHWSGISPKPPVTSPSIRRTSRRSDPQVRKIRVVAIATSTGGPAALQEILGGLPADFPMPILVVQHITPGFISSLAASLRCTTNLGVKVAEDGEPLRPGTIYLAPDGAHLGVKARQVSLSESAGILGFRPSATYLFESVANHYGRSALAVVLTGMGEDGVPGLRRIREAGGYVLIQDKDSSVVFGMPGAALAAGVVDEEISLRHMASRLLEVVRDGQ